MLCYIGVNMQLVCTMYAAGLGILKTEIRSSLTILNRSFQK
jgi:hypothetical protein